jgi:Tol biopolymer transport system component
MAGVVATAVMFAMIGYAIGRESNSSLANVPPSQNALSVPAIGGNSPATLRRQIAMTPDGSAVVFITTNENGEEVLAIQRFGEEGARYIAGAEARLQSDLVAKDGGSARGSSLLSRLRGDDRKNPGLEAMGGARFQQMLPDGRHAIVIRAQAGGGAGPVVVRDTETGVEGTLVNQPVVEARVTSGHLVYARSDATLWAAPFNEETRQLTSQPVQIGSGVSLTGSGIAQMAVARNGNVAYIADEPRWLVLVDRNGRLRNAVNQRAMYRSPRFSPDGRRVSVDFTGNDGRDIWIYSLDARTLTRGTFTRDAHDAEWTPDGERITFTSFSTGSLGIFRGAPGVNAAPDSVFASPSLSYTGAWLPDGSGLLTVAENLQAGSQRDIAVVANGGRGPVDAVIADGSRTQYPALSPDGRWLAYVSNRTGTDQVYVRPWRRDGPDVPVSRNGGSEPVWGPDSKELFYRGTNGRYPVLIVASVAAEEDFNVTDRFGLFPIGDIAAAAPQANYDISPDGRTFVMVRLAQSSRINVVRNLPGLLERSAEKK